MTDDAKLRDRAAAWMVARGVRSNGSDIITQSLAAEFAAVAAEARREALMEAEDAKKDAHDFAVLLDHHNGKRRINLTMDMEQRVAAALADTPRADGERTTHDIIRDKLWDIEERGSK